MPRKKKATQHFILTELFRIVENPDLIRGVILFGSRVNGECREDSDWDIGIIHDTPFIRPELPDDSWDMFYWSIDQWINGFVLQIELARSYRILHDPDQIIISRMNFLKEKILPHWAGYLRRI